jgi:transposase
VPTETVETSAASLPTDLATCHALIRELMDQVQKKDLDNFALKQRMQGLLREKFGKKSEKVSVDQLMLFAEHLCALMDTQESVSGGKDNDEPIAADRKNKNKKHGGGGRGKVAAHVRRERRHYHPPDLLCECGSLKEEFASDTVEQLDYIPASFIVVEHVTHKYICKTCRSGVLEGERPAQVHNGGKPAEGLIAQIATAKYADHSPLERQANIYAREGVDVAASSMGRWLEMSAKELKRITGRMHELLAECAVLQVDESPFDLRDGNRPGKKIKKGYVWVMYGDAGAPYTYFKFESNRNGDTAKALLARFKGFLLTDGYSGYEWYRADRSANCNVHARRYFEKASKCDKKRAGAVISLYAKLYAIEANIKGKDAQEILIVRQEQSLPILHQIQCLLQEWQTKEPAKTSLGIAINYALSRWHQLILFTAHPELPMDTNLVENAIRPIALGRKNWLRISGEGGLQTASVHATLINTCKRLGINPYLYLRDVLIRLGEGVDSIDDLLPDRWQMKHAPPYISVPPTQKALLPA